MAGLYIGDTPIHNVQVGSFTSVQLDKNEMLLSNLNDLTYAQLMTLLTALPPVSSTHNLMLGANIKSQLTAGDLTVVINKGWTII